MNMSKLSGQFGHVVRPEQRRIGRISDSPFVNSGDRKFTPPGNNADGDSDWVLVLTTLG